MGNRRTTTLAALSALVLGLLEVVPMASPAGAASPATSTTSAPLQTQIVSPVPAAFTPDVDNGHVSAIAQVGSTMIVGGTFTSVNAPKKSAITRNYLFAFDATTGAISDTFVPALNGVVNAVLPGPSAGTVYVAGKFTTVNGAGASHLVLLDVITGKPVSSFHAAVSNGQIRTMAVDGSHLIIGGDFHTVGGVAHGGLASVNATTGALDPFVDNQVAGHHNNTGSGAQGAVGVRDLAVTPDGSRMVIIGNFRTVDSFTRVQVAVIDLGGSSSVVDPNWATTLYEPLCFYNAFDTYMRGVSVSPDGTYFVIASTGGPNKGTLCDVVARWDFSATGQNVQPTWVDSAGGDTVWAVSITEKAVYVGGHERWMNNSHGSDSPGEGAVPRPGLMALDAATGLPLKWNPGRNPRGVAVFALLATPSGLWLGSNTDYIGDHRYYRAKLAFFPLAGGSPEASDNGPGLPGTVYVAGQGTNTLQSVSFNGTTAGTLAAASALGVSWSSIRGAFMIGHTLYYGWSDGRLYRRTFSSSAVGAATVVDPYHDPYWDSVNTGSGQTYTGTFPDLYGKFPNVTGMSYSQGRLYYTLSGSSKLYWRYFNVDSGITGSDEFTATSSVNWSQTDGFFINGSTMYVVNSSDGSLSKVGLSGGSTTGSLTLVDSSNDWRGRALFIGKGPFARAPTAKFTVSCASLTCSVNASGSTDPQNSALTYAWNFGDNGTGTGVTTSHTYPAGGTYSITLAVTDQANLTGTVSHQVAVVRTLLNTTAPSISGRPRVGSVLTADPGTWSPSGATYSYQWYSDSTPVGTDSSTYTPVATDVGHTMKVAVTASLAGYADGKVTSAVTTVVKVRPTIHTRVRVRHARHLVRLVIRVTAPGVSPVVGRVRIIRGTHVLRTVTLTDGRVVVRLRHQPTGRHLYKIRYLGHSPALRAWKRLRITI